MVNTYYSSKTTVGPSVATYCFVKYNINTGTGNFLMCNTHHLGHLCILQSAIAHTVHAEYYIWQSQRVYSIACSFENADEPSIFSMKVSL